MQLFDLHCDSIVNYKALGADFLCGDTQFSLRELDRFDRLCQTMAIFIPDTVRGEAALDYFKTHYAYLKALAEKQSHLAELASTVSDIERINREKKCALLLAVESGAVLAGEVDNVDYLAACGVKMMTLVWNGANELASGHKTDQGFTAFGKVAVRRMEEQNILVDVSHLNDRGFEELCEFAEKPFIATHSNLRTRCAHKRNLTEQQFTEIVERQGLVGVNLYEQFLADDHKGDAAALYAHIERMLELGGEDVIACGSDFDGADIDSSLDSAAKFAEMADYLLQKGVKEGIVRKLQFENALEFLRRQEKK